MTMFNFYFVFKYSLWYDGIHFSMPLNLLQEFSPKITVLFSIVHIV